MNGEKDFKKPLKPDKISQTLQDNQCPLLKTLTDNLEVNLKYFKEHFKDCSDVIFRNLSLDGLDTYLIYTDGMVDKNILFRDVISNLFLNKELFKSPLDLEEKAKLALPVGEVSFSNKTTELLQKILYGNIIILFRDIPQAIVVALPSWAHRGIEASETEPSLKGQKESFTETLSINISLLRRRILHPDCKFVTVTLGKYSNTTVTLAYISSIAKDSLVKEVRNRLESIDMDALQGPIYIEELIEDAPHSPFPTTQTTERPDKVAGSLFEGRIAILQENTPYALLVPSLLINFLISIDDYNIRYWAASFARNLRYLAIFLTVFSPALFVAFTTFNQEMIPTQLLISIAYQREGVPFPAIVEALLMILAFEILKEAGTRLPKPIGQAVSIVGALIIGDASVKAGLVSPAMVIVIAMTAIASFTIPSVELNEPIVFIRFFMTILSGLFGFWGIFVGLVIVLGHLTSLRSFGIPYTTPFAPVVIEDLDDVLVRAPQWTPNQRPRLWNRKNIVRKGKNLKPLNPLQQKEQGEDKK